jgi:hydroxyacylglutathione hydrolase
MSMQLVALSAFTDNYVWMLHDGVRAVVVDPGEAAPVEQALEAASLVLAGILVTHHHGDHVAGIAELRARLQGPVWAPRRESIPGPCTPVDDGDHIDVLGIDFEVIDVPGHTAGHVAYHAAQAPGGGLLFCGDTLFSGGCGRLFEGTPAQMHASLSRLAALPGSTRVCCAHEYTLANLRFARAVEPGNASLMGYEASCTALRDQAQSTLPSSIDVERRINPFLRCREPAVVSSARQQGAENDDPVSVFAALREWKNRFR